MKHFLAIRSWLRPLACGLSLAIFAPVAHAQRVPAPGAKPAPPQAAQGNADEAAIRATAAAYTNVFRSGNAKAVAGLWAPDAQYIDESGTEFRGRDAIEKHFAEIFAEHPNANMEIAIGSIRLLGPDVAIETGTARPQGDSSDPGVKYSAVHVKRDGKWLLANVSESRIVADNAGAALDRLSWLVGEWKATTGGKSILTRCDWIADKHFLQRSITVTEKDQVIQTGTQIIGWDPLQSQIVSWTFDSQGGISQDSWSLQGKDWVSLASSVLADGRTGAARNIIIPQGENAFLWQSVERTLDGLSLPDTAQVRVERVLKSK